MTDIGGLIRKYITIRTWILITIKFLTAPLDTYHRDNTLPIRAKIIIAVPPPVATVTVPVGINRHHVVYHG